MVRKYRQILTRRTFSAWSQEEYGAFVPLRLSGWLLGDGAIFAGKIYERNKIKEMKTNIKRFLAFMLVLVMVFAYVPAGVFATEGAAPELPTATVTEIQNDDLTFAMNFKADEVTDEQLAYYGAWYADYELTVNKEVTFDANGTGDGWLSGQYDASNEYYDGQWINVPFKEPVTLEANETIKIMAFAAELMGEPGLKYTYKEVYEGVKDFDCGVFFDADFLTANPDLKVTLELKMYNPANESESYVIGDTYIFESDFVAVNYTQDKLYTDVSKALEAAASGETVQLLKNAQDKIVTVLEDTTLDLNGYNLTADYVACFGDIVDNSSDNTGRLAVDPKCFLIQESNKQLPVNTADGYLFAEVLKFNEDYNGTRYAFQPIVEAAALEALKAGGSGVTVEVLISWNEGTRRQSFVFSEDKAVGYFDSYNSATGKFSKMFTLGLTGADNLDGLQFQAELRSNTGVVCASADKSGETVTKTEQTLTTGGNTALVQEGTKVNEGTALALTITEMPEGESNIEVGEGESKKSVDIHVTGVAADNEKPIIVTLPAFAEKGLNEGNLTLYHVENGVTNPMTQVVILDEVDAHNEFWYDPATGDVVMALTSFSEIAMVSDDAKKWNGVIDTTWYTDAAEAKEFEIFNADQLAGLGKLVDEGNTFEGKTIKLCNDINLEGYKEDGTTRLSFNPIGYGYESEGGQVFKGTFDGNGCTISNLYQNGWDLGLSYSTAGGGLFASAVDATFQNLTLDNAYVVMECIDMGTLVGYAYGKCHFENIFVTNSIIANYNRYTGGVVGEVNGTHTFVNVDVDAGTTISALWGTFDPGVGGIIGGKYGDATVGMKGCDVACELDVFNDVTSAYRWYSYRRCGMLIGNSEGSETIDGRTEATADYLTTEDCTVTYGDWVHYHYCKFSNETYPYVRVEKGLFNDAFSNARYGLPKGKDGVKLTAEQLALDPETHAHSEDVHFENEDHYIEIIFNQLYGGGQGCYGGNGHVDNGVTVYGLNGEPIPTTTAKFTCKLGENAQLETEKIYTLGDLFAEIEGVDVKDFYVYASVTPVDEETSARGTFTKGKNDDWTTGTIAFTGEGVVRITISDYYFCELTTIYVTVGKAEPDPVEKFTPNAVEAQDAYTQITLGELFTANDGVTIGNVTATVTDPNGTETTISGTASDWEAKDIDLTKDGEWTVVIQDDNYCIPVTATITVNKVEKFTANEVEAQSAYTQITLGELFSAKAGATIGNVTAAVTVDGESVMTINGTSSDWTTQTIELTTAGTWTVEIQDDGSCLPTEVTFIVNKVEKFTDKDVDDQNAYTQIALGDMFTADANAITGNVTATVTDPNGNETTVSATSADWTTKTIDLTKDGEWTVVIKDDDANAEAVTVTFTVNKADKFTKKFDKDFLYRVGNAANSPVGIGYIFGEVETALKLSAVSVEIETVTGASGTYTSATTWTNGTIQFSGTGVVKVTISADGANDVTLYLEVVDATNVTGLSGTISGNVVLLQDCGLSSLTVSDRNTVYGNGFTATYTGNGQYLNNGLKQGVVTVSENGTLDNLRIQATIYPAAYLYYGSNSFGEAVQDGPSSVEGDKTRYHYQLSAVAASGNATISNCYIYGGRNNIFVNTGDVTITDTVLECGVVANVQIQSNASHTITFNNVTTIQHQVASNVSGTTSKTMLGAGILVGPETSDNPKIVLNGSFKQYNWVTADDANAVSDKIKQAIINGALDATAYNHTVNGKTASNLGIIYMNTYDVAVTNNTGLPYVLGDVAMKVSGNTINGKVYSVQGATAEQIYSDNENAVRATINGYYEPQFKYSDDLGGQYIEKTDDGDEFCYRSGDTIYVMFPTGDTKELDLAALVNITKYSGQDLGMDITCKDDSGNTVTVTDGKVSLTDAGEYAVTYAVTDDMFFDKNGQAVTKTAEYSWDVTLSVSLKDTAVPNAYFVFDNTKQKMGYEKKTVLFSTSIYQYLPFLAGLKIYDYNGQTEYLRFDGDSKENGFDKVASIDVTNKYSGNDARVVVKLTDGGVIDMQFLARADSGGGSTYTGSIKTSGNTIYFVNDGTTSEKDATTTAAYWIVDYYKFTGNNGTPITTENKEGPQTFNSTGSSASTPSGTFSTTINYTVTYDANEGNCGQTVGYATSASAAVTLPTPTRSGFMFTGWYTAASGGTNVDEDGDGKYTPTANITLYAQWGKPSTVTYDANGGSCGTASEKYTGTALTLPTPTRDGYWFTGWFDAAEGGNEVKSPYNPKGDITLYAHWQEAIEYTVTYNPNGGTCDTVSATYQGTALILPTPTRTGYKFLGWYTAATEGEKKGDAGATYTPAANITLYAQWEQISYTVTINKQDNATVTVDKTTAHYNDTVSVTVSFSQNNNKKLTVKDASGNEVLSKSAAGTYTFTMPASNVTIEASSSGGCVTPDTLVTLADGTQKRIDSVSADELLLVWDFYKGEYAAVPASILVNHGRGVYTIATLTFSDGTEVNTINGHGFFHEESNQFIVLNEENAADYIGDSFLKQDGDGFASVTLVDVTIEKKEEESWGILTAVHYNCFLEGMLTMTDAEVPGTPGYLMPFEIGEGMKYDEEKMQADIEQYGLYTYDEFADYCTYEQFVGFGIDKFKVSVAKGYITWEGILFMLSLYG